MKKLRNLSVANGPNDGSRSLEDSIIVPEVKHAVNVWKKSSSKSKPVLIGGLAYSYYAKPRATTDVDFLYLQENDVPESVDGMKRIRPSAFQDNKTHVEVEVLTNKTLHLPQHILNKVFKTAKDVGSVRIASPEGLIALKLYAGRAKDYGDIVELMKAVSVELSLDDWHLDQPQKLKLKELVSQAKKEISEGK